MLTSAPHLADARALLAGRRVVVLTGAGISTDSGIPDYRGPGSVPRRPMTYQEFVASPQAQQRYWARAHIGWRHMTGAAPNAAHRALVVLEGAGAVSAVVTQNVDGLHEAAGQRELVTLHGRIADVVCLDCGDQTSRTTLHGRLEELNPGYGEGVHTIAPDGDALLEETTGFVVAPCERCGGRLKPDVVFFGENVPKLRVERCRALVDDADALLVVGSSLQVMSGLRFVRQAAKAGTPVVIVNRGTTRGDELATLKLDAGCAETLVPLAEALAA
ncbi:NAD-dependent protein deacetylase [Mumia zhuanghuii]|uniref:NAD-dependent protein deacetylase n=1 Tax=Mumia zhuanghuii TaxID=2585211 RepID=A0A5C4MRI5_9ACTN|nr:NAD-dependent protein deacetylase [Mumia zhuanghuii]TNC46475.1 NAD-dependent protein deacetylase [Mumia zhuanghuii]TNC47194.1 NAD-dependent protein deacetylase [Mumia zhuanghuii]